MAVADHNGVAREGLRVLAADEDHDALQHTAKVLDALGHHVTSSAVDLAEATEAIAREDPDISVVLVHDDDQHALDLIEEINAFSRGPVIALLAREEPGFLARAAERGLDAYTRGLDADRLQGAIEIALRRHEDQRRLETKVEQLEHALERRAAIERAKGILMERHGVDEREAFDRLRRHARDNSRPVVDVARAVADGHGLLSRNGSE
jgi:response regulator NasT